MSLDDIAVHFVQLREKVRSRLLLKAGLTHEEWGGLGPAQKEEVARAMMDHMFTPAPDFEPQLMSSVDAYYTLVRGMDKHMSDVVCSFIPNVLSYTVVFATHIAMLRIMRDNIHIEDEWTVTGDDVEMATEIIYDIYEQLVLWLESEVEVGAKAAEKMARIEGWMKAYKTCKAVEIEGRGEGWILKSEMMSRYQSQQGRSQTATYERFKSVADKFQTTTLKNSKYIRPKEE